MVDVERTARLVDFVRRQLDVVIEAVVENMDVKKKVLKECEAAMDDEALFATNTSSLSVTELATASARSGSARSSRSA